MLESISFFSQTTETLPRRTEDSASSTSCDTGATDGWPRDQVELSPHAKSVADGSMQQIGITSGQELSSEDEAEVEKMKQRDQEVRAHEMAHMAAGAGLTSGPGFTYETGPDGKRYVVDGHVDIDVSPGRTAEATIRKMQQVRKAALAPAQPSGADQAVAAKAAQLEAKARLELAHEKQETTGHAAGTNAFTRSVPAARTDVAEQPGSLVNLWA